MKTLTERTTDCRHRLTCGACSLLRLPYGRQLENKRIHLRDALLDQIQLAPRQLLATHPSPRIDGYRSRAKMTLSSDRGGLTSLGYFKRRTREVVDAPDCVVLVPELLQTTHQLRSLLNSKRRFPFALRHIDLRCGTDPEKQHLTLVIKAEELPRIPFDAIAEACPFVVGIATNLNPGATAQVIKGRIEPALGVREVYVESAGLSLRVSPGSFFQVNLALLPVIHQRMAEFLGEGNLLLDLYAGVGTHGFALRDQFQSVLCVEGVRSAVADAKATIKAGRIRNVEILGSPIRRAARRLHASKPDAVVLNPSAAGAERPALDTINRSTARRLAYLSCDPQTLARDLAILVAGGFALESVQAIDMMPQTWQIESLALLKR